MQYGGGYSIATHSLFHFPLFEGVPPRRYCIMLGWGPPPPCFISGWGSPPPPLLHFWCPPRSPPTIPPIPTTRPSQIDKCATGGGRRADGGAFADLGRPGGGYGGDRWGRPRGAPEMQQGWGGLPHPEMKQGGGRLPPRED